MDGYIQGDEFAEQDDELESAGLHRTENGESASELDDEISLEDEAFMDVVDPVIDKASPEQDDSDLDDEAFDDEFDEDSALDQLEAFMADDSDVSELDRDLADDLVEELDSDLGHELGDIDEIKDELKVPLTASQQALAARRAIEERAEARRMERDLNYLDFELDD